MTAIDRQAIRAAMYHHEDTLERMSTLKAALETAAGPEIDTLAKPLVDGIRGMGIVSARHVVAAIGWKMLELES